MGHEISLSKNETYIICRVTGPFTADIARQFSQEMDQLSRKKNIKCLLADVRDAPNISGDFENYTFAYSDMTDLNLQKDVRVAILVDPADESHNFVETVTQNAGYDVRIFIDEDSVIAWFEEDVPR